MGDASDVRHWLAIHNDAYGRDWHQDDYRRAILDHPHLSVLRTFFIMESDKPLGAASMAVFRRNPAIGVGHYLGVVRRAQGRGLGRQLILHRYRALKAAGFSRCEMETTIQRTASLCLHFDYGFRPKFVFDCWNTPDAAGPLGRRLTNARLARLYREWAARRDTPHAGIGRSRVSDGADQASI